MITNPYILLSYINTKLRDQYNDIESLCEDLSYDKEEIDKLLNSIDYYYIKEFNQYKCKEK